MFLRRKPKPTSTDRSTESVRKAPQRPKGKPSLLSLEPRLMFDAAAAATAAEVKTEQAAQEQAEAAVSEESETAGDAQPSADSQLLLQAISTFMPNESRTEVVFVDPTVPNCRELLSGMDSNIEIIVLDGEQDGIVQIANALSDRTGIDAVHLISHGSAGTLQLGIGRLNADSMSTEYVDELATIQRSLSEQADILIYGCDFAEGDAGQAAVNRLAELTGADVAASTDATGFAGLGGDWVLEMKFGAIETQLVVTDEVQADWVGLLAGETPPTITNLSGDSRAYSEGAGAVVIESGNAVVADVDSTNLDTGTLTVSIPAGGDSAEDVLSIRHQGTGAGQIGVSGSTVTYQGVSIGTVAGGSSGSDLVITLNSNATPTAVTALVRNITYQNTDTDAPTTGARTVRFVLTDGDGGTSANYDTTVTVTAVNDAPVLADTVLTLTVTEDAGAPSGAVGSLVSAFTGGISDVDSGASKGLAITGSNQTNGTWYYTTNGGSTWTAVGTVSNTSALLLADNANTRVYFAPNANYNGTSSAALTVRAWDQSSGTAGSKVSTASNGGTTAFSSATDTVDVTVTAVNDAPTITNLSGDSRAYSEGAGAVVIESGNAVVADVDSTNLDTGTLTVSIPAGGDSAEDVLSIRHQGTGAGQIGVSGSTVTYQGVSIGTVAGGSSGSDLVITLNSNATPTAVTALVRNITYQNTDTDAPTTGARTVRFVLTDGDGGTSANYDTTVTVTAVNDAPVLADTVLTLTVTEDAGAPSGAVGSLVSAFTGGISDVDSGASKGLAITGSNQTNGTWYYTTNGGSTWTAVGTVSNTSALLLADNANTRVYFAPNANYNGTSSAALTVRAWDQSSGTAGSKVSTASNGGTTAFSSATDTVAVTVTAVNDAPVLADTVLTLTVTEDAGAPSGAVGSLVSAFTGGISDVDSGASKGLAITGSNQTNGTWYYTTNGGSTWTAVGTVSNTSALLLADNANTRVYFAPNANYNGTSSAALTVRAWDQSSGTAGSKVSTASNGGTTAFSSATDTVAVTVTAVNDAPVLADTVLTLTVTEDAGAPSGAVGSLVSAFTGGISDVDSGASKGLAITGSNQTNGTWYYTTNGGSTWTAVGTVSNTSALLLADNANTRVYFAPNANYSGTSSAALTVRAWDQSSGTAGSKVSTASNGGTTAFSSATDTVDVTVTAVNDAPTITNLSGDSRAYSEGAGAVVIESGNAVVADVDSTNLDTGTLTVSIPAGGDSAEDVLSIRHQGTGAGQIGVSGSTVTYQGVSIGTVAGGSSGSDLVITLNSNATPTAVTALVRNITYQNTDTDAPTTGARTVRFVLTDGDGGTSANYDTTVTVTAVNDAPVLADTVLTLTVTEDAGAPSGAVGSLVSAFTGGISDVDSGASKGLAITGSNQTNGTWYYTTNGGSTWTAVGTVSNTSALLLADNANTRVYFAPNANYNGTSSAALTVRAWDQSSGTAGSKVSTASNGGTTAFSSATDTVDVTVTAVNDAPTITNLSGDSRAYSEGAGAVVIESGNAVVADVDSTNLDTGTLTVSIPAGGDSAEDVLSIRHQGTGAGQIGVSGSTVTYQGVSIGTVAGGSSGSDLVITLNSNATPTAVTALVRNITYQNTDTDAPTTGARTVRFVLTDGDGGTSANYDTTVTVTAVNDAPTDLSLSANTVAENAANGTVVGTVSGTDPDAGDTKTYSLTDSAGGRFAIDSATGVVTVANGSLLDYESAASHMVTVRVMDSGGLTYDETFTINLLNVNEAPTDLSLSANTVAENAANGTVVGTVSGTDPDAGDTKTYSLTDSAGGRFAIDSATGVVTVANGSLLDYESAASHMVTVRVMDSGGLTYDETFTINLLNVNEAPTDLSLSANTVAENAANGTVVGTVSGTDPDAGDTKTYSLTDSAGGRFAIDSATGVVTVANGSLLDYESAASHMVTVRVMDSGGLTYDETFTINLLNVNEAPTDLSLSANTVAENAANGTVVGTVSGTDPDAGDTKTYSLTDSAGGRFAIDSATGVVTVANGSLLDYESAASHMVTVRVMDSGGLTYDETFTINLLNVNEAPTDLSLSANTVAENAANGTVVGTVSGTDPDAGDTKTYSLTDSAGGRFAIDSATGVVTVANGSLLDYESAASHMVTVRVMDSGGLTYDETFTINLLNVNEAPTDLSLSANTVAENAANGTVVGTVSGTDPDAGDTKTYSLTDSAGGRFAIDSATGVVTVANGSLLDYESAASHMVTVRVMDSGGLTYDETFTINLLNVNEAPTDLSLSANTVAENAANGTVVGTISAVDPDAGDTKTYSLTDSAGGRFAIDSATGVVTVANGSLLDYESAASHMVTVRVMDSGGLTYDETFTINLLNVNEAPTDLSLSANTVAENAANGTVVGTISAVDPDSGDTHTYTLTDTAGGRFTINSATGVITVANGALLNYETSTSYTIIVRVTDEGGVTYDKSFTITLTDEYEPVPPPSMSGSMTSNSTSTRGNGTILYPLPDGPSETGRAEFRPPDDLRKAIEIATEPSPPGDAANHERTQRGVIREESLDWVESTREEKELSPIPVSKNKPEEIGITQNHGDSASHASNRVDIQQPDRRIESATGTTMTVGLAGLALQGALGTKEKVIANIRRPRTSGEGPSSDMKSERSSEGDGSSTQHESEDEGPASNKPGPA
ncbi:MAG: cadherin domain-containing protein [Nitrospira sp.]